MERPGRSPRKTRPIRLGAALGVSVGIHGFLLLVCLTLLAGETSPPLPLSVEIVAPAPRPATPPARDVTDHARAARPVSETSRKARSRPRLAGPPPGPARSLDVLPASVAVAPAGQGQGQGLLPLTVVGDPGDARGRAGSRGGGAGGSGQGGGGGARAFSSARRGPPASPPRPLASPPPDYPSSARRRGAEGLVLVRARVGAEGEVVETRLAGSSGSRDLDASALEAVRSWRFRPALLGTRAVEAWVNVPVRFRLASGGL